MRLRAVVAALAVAVSVAFGGGHRVAASILPDGSTVGADDGADVIFAGVVSYEGGYRGKKTGGCTYEYATGYLSAVGTTAPPSYTVSGIRYSYFLVRCKDKTPYLRVLPDPPPRSIAPAARSALDRNFLPWPEVMMAPSPDNGIVTLGEWFWTTTPFTGPGSQRVVTAAIEPLGIFATVTATPVTLTFHPGDGNESVTCDGPGEVWLPEYGDELETPCMYTYWNSSSVAPNGESFEAGLEITWELTWIASDGTSGTLPDLHTITEFDHTVRELQAIIVSGSDSST